MRTAHLVLSATVICSCVAGMAQQKSCNVTPADAPVSPAKQAFNDAQFAKAYELYKAAYDAAPSDELLEGAVRAGLEVDKAKETEALVSAHPSGSAWYLMAKSRVELYHGHVRQAESDAIAALRADICNAKAHQYMARLLRLNSMYASASKQVNVAHQLDHSDPGIQFAWLELLPAADQLAYYRQLAKDKTVTEEQRKNADEYAHFLEDKMSGKGRSCHLVSTAQRMTADMTPIMENGASIAAWGLTVRINDKPTIVQIDTGASGLYINRGAAQRAGLKLIEHGEVIGIGGREKVGLAYADSIKIGDFEFADCIVQVNDQRSVAGHGMGPQGIIGMDVFANQMVTLDFPLRKLSISPLPGPASQTPVEASTEGEESPRAVLADRYAGPEVKDFVDVYVQGHNLFLPMLLNGKEELMVIDTGADGTQYNTVLVPEFTKASRDTSYVAYGVGGKNENVYTTGEVKMQMTNGMGQIQNGAAATDMRELFGDLQSAGLLGTSFLYNNVVDIDYRDGLVRMTYDRNHGHNALRPVQ